MTKLKTVSSKDLHVGDKLPEVAIPLTTTMIVAGAIFVGLVAWLMPRGECSNFHDCRSGRGDRSPPAALRGCSIVQPDQGVPVHLLLQDRKIAADSFYVVVEDRQSCLSGQARSPVLHL